MRVRVCLAVMRVDGVVVRLARSVGWVPVVPAMLTCGAGGVGMYE